MASPDTDRDRDAALSAAYRAAPAELPPPALDDAIRAAARRAVGARPRAAGAPWVRRWQAPMAVAAVLVLCVSLVALMREEGGETVRVPRVEAPGAGPATSAPAETLPTIELAPGPGASKNIGLRPPVAAGGATDDADRYSLATPGSAVGLRADSMSAPGRAAGAGDGRIASSPPGGKTESALADSGARANTQREAETPAAAKRRTMPPDESVGAPKLASAGESQAEARESIASGPRRERDARAQAPAEAMLQAASPPAAVQARAGPAVPAAVAPPMAKARAATADSATATVADAVSAMSQLPPEQWLAQIETWRRQGRLDEARASLAAFRKRYPDHPLPASLRDWAQPQ
jgi:hypothetical protein